MPLFKGARPLKRWRYVGVFCDELMACAAEIQVGPARQSFWALYTPGDSRLRQRTRMLPRRAALALTAGRLRLNDGGVALDLEIEEDEGIEATCPNGRNLVWTRKQAGVRAHGTLTLDGGAPRTVEALAVVDDTAGHHTRVTEWQWAAGVGAGADGTPIAFNLVAGVNDPPTGSERAVWIAGEPHEVAPVSFAADLSVISAADGSQLRFEPTAERARRENLLLISSDYRGPFGVFSGTLPGGIELAHGLGVAEHHRARW